VRVSLVILPTDRWGEARRQWEWADDAGFASAWTYDHIRWGGMSDGPWHAAIPVLAAAAGVTRRIRLGTLVATPNFRHPVTLARDVIALDDLSGGRFDLGIGPGSEGHDASSVGQDPWSPKERMDRFDQFLQVLRPILDGDPLTRTSLSTEFYKAVEAPSTPGTVQSPLPLTIAAGGPKGLRLAAAYGHQWVTIGPTGRGPRTPELILTAVRTQHAQLLEACRQGERDPESVVKVVLWTPADPPIDSLDQFDELVAPYQELGIDEFVLHHPAQSGPYGGTPAVFEQIAARSGSALS
jgi:alkanesulfonate monooxygenase SsuD/methylene tetrahydromethanopterin reductase-like flavin-dependent oxidoreductase (luciferase family)